MSLISATGLSQKKRRANLNQHAIHFEFQDIETFLRLKTYVIDLSIIENEKCLFIFDSLNDSYRTFLTPEIYDHRLFELTNTLNSTCEESWSKATTRFYVVRTLDLIKYETVFYEFLLIYWFSGLMIIKKNVGIDQLIKTSYRWSWYSIFSIKRWKHMSDSFLFFHGEHLLGEYRGK